MRCSRWWTSGPAVALPLAVVTGLAAAEPRPARAQAVGEATTVEQLQRAVERLDQAVEELRRALTARDADIADLLRRAEELLLRQLDARPAAAPEAPAPQVPALDPPGAEELELRRALTARAEELQRALTARDADIADLLRRAEELERQLDARPAAAPEAPAPQVPALDPPGAPAAEALSATVTTITFPVNSSYFGEDGRRDLMFLANALEAGRSYRVQLAATVGRGGVRGVPLEEALRYNHWLAERRLNRVEDWLQENARGELRIEREFRAGGERQVEVRITSLG